MQSQVAFDPNSFPATQMRERLPGQAYDTDQARTAGALGPQKTGPELSVLLHRIECLAKACDVLAAKVGSVTVDLLGAISEPAQSGVEPQPTGSPAFIRSANDAVTDGAYSLLRAERSIDRLRAAFSPSA